MLRRFRILFCICILFIAALSGAALSETESCLTLPSALKLIGCEAFSGLQDVGKIVIPEGTEEIASRAFADSIIQEIHLPKSLRQIAEDAFEGCEGLVLCVKEHSYAHLWCLERNLNFKLLPESAMQASEDVPAYWKEHINTRIRDIFQALEAAGENRSAFFWYTDAHWNDNSQRSPHLLRYLSANTPISKTNFGGDIVRLESKDPADMAYLWNWRKAANKVPNHHSVIGNHDDGTRSGASGGFDADYVYSFLLADERTDDIVSGGKFYYYMDDAAEKTRYIYLDTASDDYSFIKNSAQQSFLKETLKSTADGWHIAVIAHIWRDVDYSADPPAENGFSWSGKSVLSVLDAYNARKGEYADCGAWVEFCIGGHTHADGNFASDGGIPVVITETDSYQLRSGLNYASGTISEAAVSAVIADYNAGKLHIIRIGRGSSRTVSLKKHE